MSLTKYLAHCGIASRRKAERLIRQGHVTLNGQQAPGSAQVDPATDTVTCNGTTVTLAEKLYAVLNKPRGILTTGENHSRDKTIASLLTGLKAPASPIGRLAQDDEGALLLTNDGDLAHALKENTQEIERAYLAWIEGATDNKIETRFRDGVNVEGNATVHAKATVLKTGIRNTLIRLALRGHEDRGIRRACKALGHPVIEMRRIAIANISIEGLKPGEWRYLTQEEITELKQLAQRKTSPTNTP